MNATDGDDAWPELCDECGARVWLEDIPMVLNEELLPSRPEVLCDKCQAKAKKEVA